VVDRAAAHPILAATSLAPQLQLRLRPPSLVSGQLPTEAFRCAYISSLSKQYLLQRQQQLTHLRTRRWCFHSIIFYRDIEFLRREFANYTPLTTIVSVQHYSLDDVSPLQYRRVVLGSAGPTSCLRDWSAV
jgi:hypothetical protein